MEKHEIIKSNNLNEVRKKIDKFAKENKKIIVFANDEFNRKILENKKVDFIFGLENSDKKDRLRERNSGLNHVLCKLAKENNIGIGIDVSFLNKIKDFELSSFLSRLQQNIKLCRKYKVKMVLFNVKNMNEKDLYSLLLTFGMSTNMAKFAISNNVNF